MSNNRNRSGPRSRRSNTPTPPPMSVAPVVHVGVHVGVTVPKAINLTQPMAAAKPPVTLADLPKPSPSVSFGDVPKDPPKAPEPAPKAKEPFALAMSAPPPVVVSDPPASVVPPVSLGEAPKAPATLVAKENGHSNGSSKQLVKTLVEFAQSVPKPPESKPSLLADAPKAGGGLASVEPSSNGNKAGHAPWNTPVKIDEPRLEAKRPAPVAEETYKVERPEPATRVDSPESKRGPESKKDPGASGRHSEIDERFFEEGTRSERDMMAARDQIQSDAGVELDSVDEKAAYKMRPEVRARRAKNARYVMWATGCSMLLLLAGIVKHKMTRASEQEAVRASSAAAEITAATDDKALAKPADPSAAPAAPPPGAANPGAPAVAEAKPAEGTPPPAAAAEGKPDEAKVDGVKPAPSGEAKAEEAKGEANADPNKPAAAAAAGDAPKPAGDAPALSENGKTAAQEKHDCQVFLERSAFKKSIEAGERSVALDPTDAEAWLLLGAAYQSMGNGTEARRAFGSCLKEGKKGPLGECRAMLR